MLIKDNRLFAISNSEIVDGNFVIPADVQIIDNNAFINCTSLEKIYIPTSVKEIRDNAFYGCTNLKNIIVPHTVEFIGKKCFGNCTKLEYAQIDANISELSEQLFFDCTCLKKVILSPSIKKFKSEVFFNCTTLSNIELPNYLELIDKSCFENCISLEEITLPLFLYYIGSNAFAGTGIKQIVIPNKITEINYGTFRECKKLNDVKLPNSILAIKDNAFEGCTLLDNIELPSSINDIGNSVFSKCYSLRKIVLPEKVQKISSNLFSYCRNLRSVKTLGEIEEIGSYAFYFCGNIKEYPFEKGLKKISSDAFSHCKNLQEVCLPDGIIKIGSNSFSECESILSIYLPPSIKEIFENSFSDCYNIKEIILPSSLTNATDVINNVMYATKNKTVCSIYGQKYFWDSPDNVYTIRRKEMFDRIYSILVRHNHIYNLTYDKIVQMYEKNLNFKEIVDLMILNSRTINSSFEKELIKFDNLFQRTRFINMPNGNIFGSLDTDMALKYNVKAMRTLQKLDIFSTYDEMSYKNIVDVISLFGIFESDDKKNYRIRLLKRLFSYNYTFTNKEIILLNSNIRKYFNGINGNYYILKNTSKIPERFSIYLKNTMTESEVNYIKKIRQRFGKEINDFFKQNYTIQQGIYYIIKENLAIDEIKMVNDAILKSTLDNQITYINLNEIFTDIPRVFNFEILNFFYNNFNVIISKRDYRIKFKEVVKRYDEIKNYYLSVGNNRFSYYEAYNYLYEYHFFNVNRGNYEFEQLVKNAGVTDQSLFEKYQDLYETIKNKKTSIIPRVVDKYVVKSDDGKDVLYGEILRKDDPLVLVVGEISYTDCCQKINDNGYSCLIHAINDGRMLCTYLIKNNQKILLTQSWIWRNGNTICFDNIEGTNFMKKNRLYADGIAAIYKSISEKIIKCAKRKNDQIDVVMIGKANDDLGVLSKYFGDEYKNKIGPSNYYGFLDSSVVYYIFGNELLINSKYDINTKYKDERVFINEFGINITTKSIEKIGIINEKYSKINYVYELSEMYDTIMQNIGIIYGEDWYIIYKIINNSLSIVDNGMIELVNKNLLKTQEREILNAYNLLMDLYSKSDKMDDISNSKKLKYQ